MTLESKGIDPGPIFVAEGIDYRGVGGPLIRVSVAALERVWAAAVRATHDPLLGLEVGTHLRPTSWHALGFSLQASRSLRDFGERMSRYYRFVAQAAAMSFLDRDDEVVITGRPLVARIPVESEDAFCVFLIRFLSDLSEGACHPHRVCMLRERPPDAANRHAVCLGCPVDFGAASLEVRFPRALADRPFPGGSDELAQVNDGVVITYLAKLDRKDVVSRVRALVIEDLSSGHVTKSAVAHRMHMSPRTLQYKLAQRNTSFQALVDETRRGLARAYIDDRSRSLTEVAFLLGFANTSSFSRAYKRWTGHAPVDERRTK